MKTEDYLKSSHTLKVVKEWLNQAGLRFWNGCPSLEPQWEHVEHAEERYPCQEANAFEVYAP